MNKWGVHTTYVLQENLIYLEEWLAWHKLLGASYFYLFDNTGSTQLELNNSLESNGLTKYGYPIDKSLSYGECLELEQEIFSRYPVRKISWRPRENGKIVWGHIACCDYMAEIGLPDSWCAFIDIDEFIMPHYQMENYFNAAENNKVTAIRMLQKKFHHRANYRHVLKECTKTFDFDTSIWGSKMIIKLKHYIPGTTAGIHWLKSDTNPAMFDFEQLHFNHYNHNQIGHKWLEEHCHLLKAGATAKPFELVFDKTCNKAKNIAEKNINYDEFVKIPMKLPAQVLFEQTK